MKQYEFNLQMVFGCSTFVQFQAVHEIRALHYNKLKAALPSYKLILIEVVNLDLKQTTSSGLDLELGCTVRLELLTMI